MIGDKRAWDRFVEQFGGTIYSAVARTVRRHIGRDDRHVADDAAQEVFVKLVRDDYRLLRTFDPARASLATWLAVVSRSTAIDHLRRRKRGEVSLDDASLEIPAPQPPVGPDVPPVPEGLLSPRQKLILRMIYDDGLAVADVAAALAINPQTVRSQRHKAMVKLREHFGVSQSNESG